MLEKVIENKIKDYLFEKGAYYFKVHGSSFMEKGIPDIICCYKGYFIGIEVKAPGKLRNQSEYQKIHMRNILKAGGWHILVDNVDVVKSTLATIDNLYEQRTNKKDIESSDS